MKQRWWLGLPGVCVVVLVASSLLVPSPALASSLINIGPLGDVNDVSVEPVLIGNPVGLQGETWRPLFADDRAAAQALRASLMADVTRLLTAGGLRVVEKSRNVILVGFYGGKRLDGAGQSNVFLLQIWVSKGDDRSLERTIVSMANDSELAATLSRAVLEIVDDFVAMRTRYRESLRSKR